MTSFLLTLVRHGTPDAQRRIPKTVGNKNNSLSRKGYCQADLLGQKLKCEKFTHIYCSDITKAKETAVVIANHNRSCSSLPIHEDPRLEELRLLSSVKSEEQDIENINSSLLNKLETLEDIRHRAEDFFLEICDVMLHRTEHAQQFDIEDDQCESTSRNSCDVEDIDNQPSKDPANVLVVSHKGLIREMLRYFCSELGCQLPRRSGRRMNWESSYTGVSVFKVTVERTDDLLNDIHVECLVLNDNSHLGKRSSECAVSKGGESVMSTP